MIRQPDSIRQYKTAHDRYLKPAIENFFKKEFSSVFGPMVIENIACSIIDIINDNVPELSRVKHGQLVWNALDKATRADSPKRRYKTVILDLVSNSDITLFEKQVPASEIKQEVIARIIKQAYEQGGVLSSRDISLILCTNLTRISSLRTTWEKKNNTFLPHTGVIHDMGSTLTHKAIIVYKHILEKKSPSTVARETNHSQKAVDHYLKDYFRVKLLFDDNKDMDYIHQATNIAKHVICQYLQIINQYVKEQKEICQNF